MEVEPITKIYPPHLQVPLTVFSVWVASLVGYYKLLPIIFGYQITYLEDPIITAIFYAFATLVAALAFRHEIMKATEQLFAPRTWRYFAIGALLVPVVLDYVLDQGHNPLSFLSEHPTAFFPPDTLWYVLPKSMEILYQQILVVVLVYWLNTWIRRPALVIGTFAVGFCATHFLLAFMMDETMATLFTIASSVGGVCFAWLILRVRHGFALSYLLHWGFYLSAIWYMRMFVG